MTNTLITILLISFSFTYSFGQFRKPQNIEDAITYFEKKWSKKEKERFRQKGEKEAVVKLHFSTGMWIRNNWIRNDKDTSLVYFFISLGVYHPDDMSSVILRSLHRRLNNKDINMEGQVESIKKYWKPIIECDKRKAKRAEEIYNSYNVGDTLVILMPVLETNNAVYYMCPTYGWEFDSSKDLRVEGIVSRKYYLNSETNVFFDVKIIAMNRLDVKILMKDVAIGSKVKMQPKEMTIENYNR